ncbi:PREDICTED: activator of basal transcription 1-like [Trachymyrmex cornetzi]|uniref:Activator of basal transcription 1 n=1 Tax=Trachymyrmex cornetzi TaxID=471704 RepID=A0A195ELG2_9HYME|nr:PREDICTED: activator of basal transcription 1-like [Trachymyrmex cornetzi]KYN28719.1 Activator of basal transcription 1 [Trachymyrmex cornetzi]
MVQENSNESNEDNHAMDCDADELAQIQKKVVKNGKSVKRGIIYLSTIPKYMNITMIREMFSAYGKVGRVYLQLVDNETQSVKHKKKTKKVIKHFTEGWIEFESKKVAKFVAETLNNTQVSTRKKSKFYDVMWNIKYLPRFKWIHLSERLAYERAVHKQRLLTEIAQAKREINFFSYNVDRSKKLRRKHEQGEDTTFELPEVKQRDTDNEIRNKKANTRVEDRTEFLKSIFG